MFTTLFLMRLLTILLFSIGFFAKLNYRYKTFKWFIGFCLLFSWLFSFIDISLLHALLGSLAITIIGYKTFKVSKLHSVVISSFYILIVIATLILPFLTILYSIVQI